MMKLTAVLLLSCLALFVYTEAKNGRCFYKKSRCPRYVLVRRTPKYEERMYFPSWWASTSTIISGPTITKNVTLPCYKRLRGYLRYSGASMGVPVTITVQPHAQALGKFKFTMSFFLPKSHSPARPNSGVRVEKKQSFAVYVKVFKKIRRRINKKDASKLDLELRNENLSGTYSRPDQRYMTAGYDPPWIRNNTKEVWLVKNQWWGP